jgi:glucokinase
MIKKIVSWDLGATKCAAAIVEYDQVEETFECVKQFTTKVAAHTSLDDLILNLEKGLDLAFAEADALCIGGAGSYDDETLHLESGYPYSMSFAAAAKKHRWQKFAVVHDYTPVICATFTSYMEDPKNVKRLNSAAISPFGRRVALGVGTGLGLKDGVLFANGDFWLGKNEMEHIGIVAPALKNSVFQDRHAELIRFLLSEKILKEQEPLTFERILTGSGMVNLFRFCHPNAENLTPEELGKKLRAGEYQDVVDLFAWYLGLFVGTVQLTFMPESGIWITGGVILNNLNVLDSSAFHAGIEAIPGYLTLRQSFPLGVLCKSEHAFMGGAYYALKKLL